MQTDEVEPLSYMCNGDKLNFELAKTTNYVWFVTMLLNIAKHIWVFVLS